MVKPNNSDILSIAIDGPAGAGKSTVARILAKELGIAYLDTGAMYRALAWLALELGVDLTDETELAMLQQRDLLRVVVTDEGSRIFYEGSDITPMLHSAEVGQNASRVSAFAKVRHLIVAWQQQFAASRDAVLDGRDIGTVVLPEAKIKLFISASPSVRAKRRYDELESRGILGSFTSAEIEAEIIERDERDINREHSPLRQAEDAVFLDSSELSIAEVVAKALGLIEERGFGRRRE